MSFRLEQPSPISGASNAALSAYVLRRFGFKCVVFALWAGLQALCGFGFCRPLAAMALCSGILAQALGLWRRERVAAPHWTYFDEATWFVMLGSALHSLG